MKFITFDNQIINFGQVVGFKVVDPMNPEYSYERKADNSKRPYICIWGSSCAACEYYDTLAQTQARYDELVKLVGAA